MTTPLEQTIREQLTRYLRGDSTLAEFEAWLVPETWDLSPQTDAKAHELATWLILRIAEFTNGDWSEEELREALRRFQPLPGLTFSGGPKQEQVMPGLLSRQAGFSVAGTGRSRAIA